MDVTFTPSSRGLLADRVLWTPGARTEQISLIDEAQYDLHGQRQDGSVLAISRSNMPFVGRFRLELSDSGLGQGDRAYAEFDIQMPRTVAATAFAISSDVATITVPVGHEVQTDQWVVITGFATAPAGFTGVAVQVTTVTPTTFTFAFTPGGDVSTVTEAGGVKYQPIAMTSADWVTVYDNITVNDIDIVIGAARAGMYRVSMLNDANDVKQALFHSDGTEMQLQTFAHIDADDELSAAIDYDDADTDVHTNLFITGGDVVLGNRNAIATRIVVEYRPAFWTSHDTNGFACFFEQNGQIVLKNRLGATQEFAIENVGTSRPNRIASVDPNARITELLGPIT